jgi:Ca-activated chloride channel family protein
MYLKTITLGAIILGLLSNCDKATDTNDASKERKFQPSETQTKTSDVNMESEPYDKVIDKSKYEEIKENEFLMVNENPLSTFSVDVDTASYSNIRSYIENGQIPPRDAVRIEEMINYFEYDYPQPDAASPFSTTFELASAPWNPKHRLLKIGLQGKKIAVEQRPVANLVFLIDVSGSMTEELPLLKAGFKLLIDNLTKDDRVAIVVYAGNAGVVLEPTSDKSAILASLEKLQAGGSTAGGEGIKLAYDLAQRSFKSGAINRVILATDGDFNVGVADDKTLVELVKKSASEGLELSVLGFGFANLNDSMMEKISNEGNGNYAYIDTILEAKKVLVNQVSGTLVTIAKDVKIQIEFNPAKVAQYRLIGYENRMLAAKDFNNDLKDAGDIGAGHSVTALYELIPAEENGVIKGTDAPEGTDSLVFQSSTGLTTRGKDAGESVAVRLRYKDPGEDTSKVQEFAKKDDQQTMTSASTDFKFCAAVASFGMILRNSNNKSESNISLVRQLATEGLGQDLSGYRKGFLDLIAAYEEIKKN